MAAKLVFPERQCIAIAGDGSIGYMLGNIEALVRYKVGVTIIHINNGDFAGYGPGFWGKGHDPYTYVVSDYTVANMSQVAAAMGCHAERIFEPAEIIPALTRALVVHPVNLPHISG